MMAKPDQSRPGQNCFPTNIGIFIVNNKKYTRTLTHFSLDHFTMTSKIVSKTTRWQQRHQRLLFLLYLIEWQRNDTQHLHHQQTSRQKLKRILANDTNDTNDTNNTSYQFDRRLQHCYTNDVSDFSPSANTLQLHP